AAPPASGGARPAPYGSTARASARQDASASARRIRRMMLHRTYPEIQAAARLYLPATMGKGTIAILTGGGDVPGLNPAIRAITIRALRDDYGVIGIRHGWGGLVDYVPDAKADNGDNVVELSEAIVNRAGRTG